MSQTAEIVGVTPEGGEEPLNVLLIEFQLYVKRGREGFEHSAFPSPSALPPLCLQTGCPLIVISIICNRDSKSTQSTEQVGKPV